jgi:gluconolactonase
MQTCLKILTVGSVLAALGACSPKPADAPAKTEASAAAPAAIVAAPGASVLRLDPALDTVIAPGAQIEKVATGFGFAEGPMWRQGRLWFADLTGNKMFAVSPDGKTELLIDKSGGLDTIPKGSFRGSNGMVTDKDGSVLMNQHGARRIVRLDDKLGITPFIEKFDGKRLNSPNDLVFAPDGSLWITDPPYGLAGQDKDPAKEVPFNGVYRYADGKLTAVIKDMPRPNGIGFSPDGKTLYVSNSEPKMFVKKFDVAADGSVSNGKIFVEYPGPNPVDVPDGLKVDSAGDVWTSGPGGIRVISPEGKILGQIKLPEVAANLAWAEDGKTVYFTGSTSIYRLKLLTPGQLPLYRK